MPGGLMPAPAGGLPHPHVTSAPPACPVHHAGAAARVERRGFSLRPTAEGVRVTILDEDLGFGVEEGLKKVEHAITFTEQKLIDRGLG